MGLPTILTKLIPTHVLINDLMIETADITGPIKTGYRSFSGLVVNHAMTGKLDINKCRYEVHFPAALLIVDKGPVLIKPTELHDLESFFIDDFD